MLHSERKVLCSGASCLCVDGGHVVQAAIEAAHLEEHALVWTGGELAPCHSWELLAHAETCSCIAC